MTSFRNDLFSTPLSGDHTRTDHDRPLARDQSVDLDHQSTYHRQVNHTIAINTTTTTAEEINPTADLVESRFCFVLTSEVGTRHHQDMFSLSQHNVGHPSHPQHQDRPQLHGDHHNFVPQLPPTLKPMQLQKRFGDFRRFDVSDNRQRKSDKGQRKSDILSRTRLTGKTWIVAIGQLSRRVTDNPTVLVRMLDHFVPGGLQGKVHVQKAGHGIVRATFSDHGDVHKVRRLNNKVIFDKTSAYYAKTNEQVGRLQTYMNGQRRHERSSIDLPMQPMSVRDAHNKRPNNDSTCPPPAHRRE